MPTTRDETAPIPWLGEPDEVAPVAQAWTLPGGGKNLLTLRYTPTATGFLRTSLYLFWHRAVVLLWGSFLLGALKAGVIPYSGILARSLATVPPQKPILLFLEVFAIMSVVLFFSTVAMGLVLLLVASSFMAVVKNRVTLRLMESGGSRENRGFTRTWNWAHVARVEERNGDIYFIRKIAQGFGDAIPRSAFTDRDAAKQFHAVAVALWRGNGNPDAVPSAAATLRAEPVPELPPDSRPVIQS